MAGSTQPGDKVIHLVRHGQSMMNLLLGLNEAKENGEIPIDYDSKLTQLGAQQARDAAKSVRMIRPSPEVVLVSPLSRALQTAELAFEGSPVPHIAVAHARERLWCSSEVGVPRSQLAKLWPGVSFEQVEDEVWWHTQDAGDLLRVDLEPEEVFLRRLVVLKRYLEARPERSIALVAHWNVFEALTGRDFRNCELLSCRLSDLLI